VIGGPEQHSVAFALSKSFFGRVTAQNCDLNVIIDCHASFSAVVLPHPFRLPHAHADTGGAGVGAGGGGTYGAYPTQSSNAVHDAMAVLSGTVVAATRGTYDACTDTYGAGVTHAQLASPFCHRLPVNLLIGPRQDCVKIALPESVWLNTAKSSFNVEVCPARSDAATVSVV